MLTTTSKSPTRNRPRFRSTEFPLPLLSTPRRKKRKPPDRSEGFERAGDRGRTGDLMLGKHPGAGNSQRGKLLRGNGFSPAGRRSPVLTNRGLSPAWSVCAGRVEGIRAARQTLL